MNDPNPPPADPDPAAPFDKFKALATRLAQVPKSALDKSEAEYQKQQAKKPKRGPKPRTEAG